MAKKTTPVATANADRTAVGVLAAATISSMLRMAKNAIWVRVTMSAVIMGVILTVR